MSSKLDAHKYPNMSNRVTDLTQLLEPLRHALERDGKQEKLDGVDRENLHRNGNHKMINA